MNSSNPNKESYNTQLDKSADEGDGLGVEKDGQEFVATDEDDFPLGKACDRFDPTCESCQ